jgi:hypothetical protein
MVNNLEHIYPLWMTFLVLPCMFSDADLSHCCFPCLCSPINILFQLDSVSPLCSHLLLCSCDPFAFSFFLLFYSSPVHFSFTAGFGSCSSFIHVFMPSKQWTWDCHSSGILCCITGFWVPSILRLCSGPIFRGQMDPWRICEWVSSHTGPLHFIDPTSLSFFFGHPTLDDEATTLPQSVGQTAPSDRAIS